MFEEKKIQSLPKVLYKDKKSGIVKKDKFDPNRIFMSLRRETDLSEKEAEMITLDVFRFIASSNLKILTAPLINTDFEPDLVIVYCDTNQLRSMLLSLNEEEKPGVKSNFFPFSCAWAVTSPIIHNEYWVNLPDPGEYVRALTQAGEMIFSIPAPKLDDFMSGIRTFFEESMFANEQMMMESDFPQPEIYRDIFKKWDQ